MKFDHFKLIVNTNEIIIEKTHPEFEKIRISVG